MHFLEQNDSVANHVETALQLLEQKESKKLGQLFLELHPVELVAVITSVEEDLQPQLLKHITGLDHLSEVITHAGEHLRQRALEMIDESRIAAVVRRQDIDDAADLVGSLTRRRRVRVLKRLGAECAREITAILAYDQETAGRIMTTRFLSYLGTETASDALQGLREDLRAGEIEDDTDLNYGFVLDTEGKLRGVFSLREVLTALPDDLLEDVMNEATITIGPDEDQEIAARRIADYDLSAIPVVHPEDGTMLGVITVDDVLDVIEEEHTEDILRLVGTEDNDTVGASLIVAIRSRLPWLIASWLGGTSGAWLLGSFSSALEKLVALAFFMPVVFGMGGNVGSQASTITVRGLATGDLGPNHLWSRLQKEALVGASLGIVFGLLLSLAAYALFKSTDLSVIVGVSIASTMICAASLGSMLPVFFQRFGIDPAVASGPLVSTTTDILSITIYFSIAGLFL